jgi:acyl carrier protein
MPDVESRLAKCFAEVFPGLAPDRFAQANIDNVLSWDSLHTITLVAAIEEEFEVQISAEELPKLNSFEAVRSYLERAYANR